MRAFRWSAVVVAAVLATAACSAGSSVDTGSGPSGGSGDKNTLNAAISSEPDQLDPQKTTSYNSFEVLENVFDTLVEPDENLEMKPALATSWTTAKDQLSWTFKLRPGVKFHNGDPFDADSVVYSYNRIIKGKLSNAYRFDSVKGVKKVDDSTVEIDLTRPTPNLLSNIGSFKGMAIVDKQNAESGDIKDKPVGTGPFSFVSYQPGNAITLKANPDYWDGAPKIGQLKFTFVSQATTALASLQSGQIQWTDNVPPSQVSTLAKGDDPKVSNIPSNDYWYFALNEGHKPYDDPRVRQAFAWAIDRNALAQAATFGAAVPNQAAIPKSSPWFYDYAPYKTDPAKAEQLLQQAGVSNLKVDFLVSSGDPYGSPIAQVLKDQLSKAGITLNIRTEDFNTWLADESSGKNDAFMLNWIGNVDPDDFYYGQHHTGGANNYQKFSDKAVDKLLDQGRTETDQTARKQIYDQAAKRIVDEASYVYLYNPNVVEGWSGRLQGFAARQDRAVRFRDASLTS